MSTYRIYIEGAIILAILIVLLIVTKVASSLSYIVFGALLYLALHTYSDWNNEHKGIFIYYDDQSQGSDAPALTKETLIKALELATYSNNNKFITKDLPVSKQELKHYLAIELHNHITYGFDEEIEIILKELEEDCKVSVRGNFIILKAEPDNSIIARIIYERMLNQNLSSMPYTIDGLLNEANLITFAKINRITIRRLAKSKNSSVALTREYLKKLEYAQHTYSKNNSLLGFLYDINAVKVIAY